MLKLHKDKKIRYNHPKLVATQEYKAPESDWEWRISEVQSEDKSLDDYVNWEIMYILKTIVKKFVKEFHKNLIQRHNGVIALVARLQEKYIIYRIQGIARKIISEYLNCQRNKSARHKLYGML